MTNGRRQRRCDTEGRSSVAESACLGQCHTVRGGCRRRGWVRGAHSPGLAVQNWSGGVAALVWAGDEAGQSRSRMIDVTGQATLLGMRRRGRGMCATTRCSAVQGRGGGGSGAEGRRMLLTLVFGRSSGVEKWLRLTTSRRRLLAPPTTDDGRRTTDDGLPTDGTTRNDDKEWREPGPGQPSPPPSTAARALDSVTSTLLTSSSPLAPPVWSLPQAAVPVTADLRKRIVSQLQSTPSMKQQTTRPQPQEKPHTAPIACRALNPPHATCARLRVLHPSKDALD
ncbi:uncharacterized protein IWZ02DRAFT_65948 [Phyllosticta citriasiana]|uniref:Uncharacterized protein n=1 Tax=Phyllosticta citriasiana TaxID=595635 RepID=A0ABR1K875_9PEZI